MLHPGEVAAELSRRLCRIFLRGPDGQRPVFGDVALRPSVRIVRGRLDPHNLALLRQWIDLNEQVLIDYWNGVIGYTEDTLNALRPIEAVPD
jgi:hypothetical protein